MLTALAIRATEDAAVGGVERDAFAASVAVVDLGIDRLLAVPAETVTAPGRGVRDVDRLIRRLQAYHLALVAAADRANVAATSGASGTGSWLAWQTRMAGGEAAAQVGLAVALTELPATSAALAAGSLSTKHAAVIAGAAAQLPQSLSEATRTKVEADLVRDARVLDPATLRRAARRAVAEAAAKASPDAGADVDTAEGELLRTEEDRALRRTTLTMHDNGDGTTSGHFVVPTLAASILRKIVQQMTSPRRQSANAHGRGASDDSASSGGRTSAGDQRPPGGAAPSGRARSSGGAQSPSSGRVQDWAHERGLAFAALLERLPTDHLHGKVAATVLVTMELDALKRAVGVAISDTGVDLSASMVRRLACDAGFVPLVLGGRSLPLDLGRSERFFTEPQRVALGGRYTECAAEGCDRPYAWCELHHEDPWAGGGRTDLDKAIPLCGHHHRRVHDPRYRHVITRGAIGTNVIRFTLRT